MFPFTLCCSKAFLSLPLLQMTPTAGALAQLWNHEKNLTKKDLIYIVAGQGIGCGMISDGAILQGAIGIAGEIGHTTIDYHGPRCACGNYGCLELYASVLALKERIRTRLSSGEKSQCILRRAERSIGKYCNQERLGRRRCSHIGRIS